MREVSRSLRELLSRLGLRGAGASETLPLHELQHLVTIADDGSHLHAPMRVPVGLLCFDTGQAVTAGRFAGLELQAAPTGGGAVILFAGVGASGQIWRWNVEAGPTLWTAAFAQTPTPIDDQQPLTARATAGEQALAAGAGYAFSSSGIAAFPDGLYLPPGRQLRMVNNTAAVAPPMTVVWQEVPQG